MSLLESDEKFGFIVMDGNGCLYATLSGNAREVLHKFTVELPKKHGRGGQSSVRFARIRVERRHNYLRKCAEIATSMFITNDKPNVSGLIVAGSADFKTELSQSDLFDARLNAIVLKVVDVAYGFESGFNQAIELAKDCLSDLKFVKEKKVIDAFMVEVATDSGKAIFGPEETVKAMEMGAVDKLIVWEDLQMKRFKLTNPTTQEETILLLTEDQEKQKQNLFQDENGQKMDVESVELLEWLAENYTKYGVTMEFVSNKSQEGAQFCRGFGGIGGMLRYRCDFDESMQNLKIYDSDDDDEVPEDNDLSEFM
jgi:peptide chain release factor subunit 1